MVGEHGRDCGQRWGAGKPTKQGGGGTQGRGAWRKPCNGSRGAWMRAGEHRGDHALGEGNTWWRGMEETTH